MIRKKNVSYRNKLFIRIHILDIVIYLDPIESLRMFVVVF